jgi:hypothetical protein
VETPWLLEFADVVCMVDGVRLGKPGVVLRRRRTASKETRKWITQACVQG